LTIRQRHSGHDGLENAVTCTLTSSHAADREPTHLPETQSDGRGSAVNQRPNQTL